MTKNMLCTALCDLADAMQTECARLSFSPLNIPLEAITERLDVVIDTVLDEGVHEESDHAETP